MTQGFHENYVTSILNRPKRAIDSLDYNVRGNEIVDRSIGLSVATIDVQLNRGSGCLDIFIRCNEDSISHYLQGLGLKSVGGSADGKTVYKVSVGIPKGLRE